MSPSDYMIRATGLDGKVRAFGVLATQTVNELHKRHQTSPVVTAAVGRTMIVTAIMGWMLKGDERITVQIKGGGPVGQIVADADSQGHVRAYMQEPRVDVPLKPNGKLDVAAAVGVDGFLHVIKDLRLREPYRGSVPLVSGEIGEDFAYYFTQSEQTPSAVGVGVLVAQDYTVKVAGGFLLQMLPGATDEEISLIEEALANLQQVTTLLSEGDMPEDLLRRVIPGEVKVHERVNLSFQCNCNWDRLERVLMSLREKEILELIEEQGEAEITCTFCQEPYHFDRGQLQEMVGRIQEGKGL